MNATICPTITAADAAAYQRQLETIAGFAGRIHIDLADGSLAPGSLVSAAEVWWPANIRADIHVMYKKPLEHLETLIALRPQLIILHAEGQGDYAAFAQTAHHYGIETGVALLQTTPVETIKPALDLIDHVLVFSGNLGEFGGKANPALLSKVRMLKQLKPQLEIGWDGGINAQNVSALARAGVEVLNVGGFIHHANNPALAYGELVGLLGRPRPAAATEDAIANVIASAGSDTAKQVQSQQQTPQQSKSVSIAITAVRRGRSYSIPVR